jgi:hypothetical protein
MSSNPEDIFFKVVNFIENSLTIIRDVQGAQEQNVQIDKVQQVETRDGKPVEIFITDKGRKFARLKEWPKDRMLEV